MTGITQVAAGLMGFGAAFAAAFFAAAEVLGRAFFAAFLAGVDFAAFTAAHGFFCASAMSFRALDSPAAVSPPCD